MKDQDRRYLLVEVDQEVLMAALGLRGSVTIESDLPPNVELVQAEWDMGMNRLLLKLRHPSFSVVHQGAPIQFPDGYKILGIIVKERGASDE